MQPRLLIIVLPRHPQVVRDISHDCGIAKGLVGSEPDGRAVAVGHGAGGAEIIGVVVVDRVTVDTGQGLSVEGDLLLGAVDAVGGLAFDQQFAGG